MKGLQELADIQLPRSARTRNPKPEDKLYDIEAVERDDAGRTYYVVKSTILDMEMNTLSGKTKTRLKHSQIASYISLSPSLVI